MTLNILAHSLKLKKTLVATPSRAGIRPCHCVLKVAVLRKGEAYLWQTKSKPVRIFHMPTSVSFYVLPGRGISRHIGLSWAPDLHNRLPQSLPSRQPRPCPRFASFRHRQSMQLLKSALLQVTGRGRRGVASNTNNGADDQRYGGCGSFSN